MPQSSPEAPDVTTLPNVEVDENGEWAQKYHMEGLPGATVFYDDHVCHSPLIYKTHD